MKVFNQTKKRLLSPQVEKITSFTSKSRGLIGQKVSKGIFFQTRLGIHTFGVRFPLDILILNNDMRVVSMKKSLQPSRIFIWNPIYSYVFELPSGIIEQTHTELGDKITLT